MIVQVSTPGIKRILFCEGNIDGTIGGSYFSLLFLVAGLDRSKFEPIVVFRSSNVLIPRFKEYGVRTLIIPLSKPTIFRRPDNSKRLTYRLTYLPIKVLQRLINFAKFFPIGAYRCGKLLRREGIDLVHLNNSVTRNHEWMIGALLTRTPCVTHERGINLSYSWLSRYLARRISGVICISQAVKVSLEKGGVRPKLNRVIYNGLDPKEMTVSTAARIIRERHSIPFDAPLIGVVGNIRRWKGQETVIQAMPSILARHPKTYCMFIGATTENDQLYLEELKRQIASRDLSGRVIFTGYTKDVPDYMNALDIVLHTSVAPEPFGRVLIEAMALKKPLIGSAAGAIPEIIDESRTGLTFKPGDSACLGKCILRLLDSKDEAQQMGNAGFDRLESLFHIRTNIAKTQDFYVDIFENRRKTC